MSGAPRRILIADDHGVVRRGVRALLETRPNLRVVAEAADGLAAVELARETQPDIAVIDYALPGLGGPELIAALRREAARAEVLVYTVHDREELVLEALRAGARGYVLKSDAEKHLLAAIDALAIHRPYFWGAISDSLLEHFVGAAASPPVTLTRREREVVKLIAEGKINKEVSHILDISVKTVETHRASAMRKLKLRSTADLVRFAMRNNLVDP